MLDETKSVIPAPVYEAARYPALPFPGASYTVLPDAEPAVAAVPLAHYLWLLKRHRYRLLGFIGGCVTVALLVSLQLTPTYEATTTIDIDRQTPPGIVGQESTRASLNDADQFLATQVKLLQSDTVLRPIERKFHLLDGEDANAEPTRSAAAMDAPIVLKNLKVTRPPNTYLLLVSYRSHKPKLAADVANGIAHSYIAATFDMRFKASASLSEFMETQIEELKAKMERSSAALAQFERDLNVINPEEKTSILSARLLQLNTEYTSAQTDRVRKQAEFESLNAGSLEAAQSSAQAESLNRLSEHLTEAQEKFAQVRAQYGVNHPEFKKAAAQVAGIEQQLEKSRKNILGRVTVEQEEALNRERMLRKAVFETKAEFDAVNARSFEYQQVKREAEADKKLYEELASRIKEAGINANFQNSSIRLADDARPPIKPVFPNIPLNLLLAFLFSALLGVGAAVLADVLDTTVRDPDEMTKSLKTPVIGTLPSVKTWRKRQIPVSTIAESNKLDMPNDEMERPAAGFAESIRTLRNAILLADFDRRLKTILLTSASAAEGKSTIAAYLSIAHAKQGKKTLLIDGDLRRPSVHRRFDLPSGTGLSNVVLGEMAWRDVVLPVPGAENLDVLPAGPPNRRAADIVGAEIGRLLEEASRDYDLVILDAPPVLGFAEPIQMATAVDGVLIVARAGETNRKALGAVVTTLTRLRTNVIGLVLNEVRKETHEGYYYGYYGDYYKYYSRREEPLGRA